MAASTERLTKRNLWSFTLASIGRDTATYLWSGFLITYVLYTKTLSDAQFSVLSVIMVSARVFDAFNDPVMGNVLEVTRTKWGKFKPWIALGMVFSAAVYLVSFTTTLDGWHYVVLFGILYFAYSIVFTMNDIAYWGMLPSLASEKSDRDLLTSRAVLFAGIGAAIAVLIVPTFTAGERAIGGSAVSAYRVIVLLFAALFIGAQMITLVGVKEKPLPPKGAATVNKVSLGTIFRTIKNNDQLSWCILVFILAAIGRDLLNGGLGSMYIYFEFGYNGFLVTVFAALGAVASAAVMLFYAPISKRFTRGQLMRIAVWSTLGGYAAMLLFGLALPPAWGAVKFALMMLSNLFAFGGQSVYYLVIMICIVNTVEYNEWKTGARAEGIIYSVRPFVTKLAGAFVQLTAAAIFVISGVRNFTNQISALENAAAKGLSEAARIGGIKDILANVPPGKSAALLVCMTVIPSVLALASYLVYRKKFIIDEAYYDRMLADLARRKEAAASD